MRKKTILLVALCAVIAMSVGTAPPCRALETDETGLFTSIAPDAMIVLDLSGSMKWNPPGDHNAYNYL